jgi:AraC-like DNA-binding protein
LVALMLHELSGRVTLTNGRSHRNGNLVNRVRTLIATTYNRPISTSSIAAELGYHPDYVERIFHGEVGRSLTEAIHRCRIKEARRQLANNQKNINEIAYAVGFTDPGYFRRLFRRYTDMTPSRFRSLYGHVRLRITAEESTEGGEKADAG